ncbi:MAG TPA: NAD-dependent epimerase/dehydratase family protein [bacterium]|nr:NAD-dependent epimerase/dehydratase family protein [bacterium]
MTATRDPLPKTLVTGATGFIGSHLSHRLLATGVPVRALVRRQDQAAALAAAGAEVVIGDLSNSETLRGACRGCSVVFHCGAWLGRPYTREIARAVNVAGTSALARDALAEGVTRFVHLSSIAVYGPVRSGLVTESSPLWRGVELYGDSKIRGEEAVGEIASQGLPAVIVRPGMVYGPRSRGWTIRFTRWIQQGRPAMVAGGRALCRPIFVDNLIDALLLCAQEQVVGHAFTLVDQDMPWRDYLGYYARMVGRRVRSIPYPAAWMLALGDELRAILMRRPPRVRRTTLGYVVSRARFSTDKARTLLGWSPQQSIDEAMETTGRWLRANGHLTPGA